MHGRNNPVFSIPKFSLDCHIPVAYWDLEDSLPRIHFQQQLAELKDKILGMAALSQQALDACIDAFLQRNDGLVQFVRENEKAINSAQRELDEMAYDLLAKEQPMAIDLRFI